MSKRSAMFYVAGIAVCVAAYIFSRLEVEYECQIDFLYEDRLVWNAQTRNDEIAKSADEHNRNAVFESLVHDFAKGMSPFDSLEQRVCRCREDTALAHEDAKRIERVLSTLHFDVIERPTSNFVFVCRLTVKDGMRRNLSEIARVCMDIVEEKIRADNQANLWRCAYDKFEPMRRNERRIDELEEISKKRELEATEKDELASAKESVARLRSAIDAIEQKMRATRWGRIRNRSQPRLCYHVLMKTSIGADRVRQGYHSKLLQ